MADVTRRPTSNVLTTNWSYYGGGYYQAIDETTPNDGTDYVWLSYYYSVPGSPVYYTSSYGFSSFNIPTGSTSISLTLYERIYFYFDCSEPNYNTYLAIRIGSTYYYSSAISHSSASWATYNRTWSTNPATSSAWTSSSIDTINAIGFRGSHYYYLDPKLGPSNSYHRFSTLWAVVTYTPPSSSNYAFAGLGVLVGGNSASIG